MPLISVVVPVYKVEAYLDKCVASIAAQTYRNLEIILVDDGSPDRCPAMCDAWAEKDSRVKVIHKENGGLSDARNAGMAIASGAYIGFVDSDDWIAPEMYQRLLAALQRDGSDIAACAVEMVWEDGRPSRLLTKRLNALLDKHEAQAELLAEDKLKQPVWYKLYRRAAVEGIPFETGKYHEDVFWSYQAIGRAETVSLIDYVGYSYLQRGGSIMGEGYSLKRLDALEAFCRRYAYFREAFPELAQKALCAIWNACIYHGQLGLRYLDSAEQRRLFSRLHDIRSAYPIQRSDYRSLKATHRAWLSLSRISLRGTCRIKNTIKVGI